MLLSSKGDDGVAFITQVHVIYLKKNYLVRFKKHSFRVTTYHFSHLLTVLVKSGQSFKSMKKK